MDASRISYMGPSKLTDLETLFLAEILQVADHADPENTVIICRKPEEIIVHITPSNLEFRPKLITNLLYFNRTKQARIRFSSSLHISTKVSFTISLRESILSAILQG